MATAMGFPQVGFLVLLCLSFCSARRVLTDSTDVEKPNFPRSFPATQSTGAGLKSSDGISSLGDSKWPSGGKGSHCSGGGGGGGGNCGGNEGCGGCGNFGGGGGGGGGGYCGGCGNFGGGGYCGGNGGCGCGYACGSGSGSGGGGGGGNYQGGCYCPPPPTCYPVSCPPVSNCCPVECPPGYGHPKVADQHWANSQAPASPKSRAQHWTNSKAPPKPNYSDKKRELEQKTEIDGKNETGSDGQMQEDVSKNESMN